MEGMHRGLATLATLGLSALVAGCSDPERPSATPPAGGAASSDAASSNERTLTHAQSVHLVRWATTYRSCMGDHGWALGALTKTPTRLSMTVPKGAKIPTLLDESLTCAEAQGGPPAKSSLQYRAGNILLYLPKQCLLDPKVLSS